MPRNATRPTSRVFLPARARSSAFDPRSMPGLIGWFRSDAGVAKDANGTVPNNGNSVYQWSDLSGNGNHCIQATAGSQPSLTTNFVRGLPVVTFSGSKYLTCVNSPIPVTTTHEYTIAAAVYPTATAMGTIAAGALGGASNRSFYGSGSSKVIIYHGQNVTQSLQTYNLNGWNSMVGAYSLNQQKGGKIWLNGNVVGSGQAANDAVDPALQIGAVASGSNGFIGNMAEVIVFGRRITEAEHTTIWNYFQSRYGITPLSQIPFIAFEGNSLTYGQNASSGQGSVTGTVYPGVVMSALSGAGFPGAGINVAISGTTTQQIIARSPNVYGLLGPNRRTIVCFWELTNDLVLGPTGTVGQAQAYSNAVSYCQQVRALGGKVIVFTCLPRGLAGAQFETDRTAVNSLIRSNWSSFADALADVGGDATIGNVANCSNATYYNADQIHLTDTSYAIVANTYAVPAIKSIW